MQKLKLLTISMSTLLFSACGGGGTTGTAGKYEDFIYLIMHHSSQESCDISGEAILNDPSWKEASYELVSNDVNCQTYGRKTNPQDGCAELKYQDHINNDETNPLVETACVTKAKRDYDYDPVND